MLIRSQDKERIMDFNSAAVGIDPGEGSKNDIWITMMYPEGSCILLGRYSSEKKALKALDMIQEAYTDAEVIKMTIPEIGKAIKEAPATKENELMAEAIEKVLMDKMVFQMPEDSEVKA